MVFRRAEIKQASCDRLKQTKRQQQQQEQNN